MMRRNLYAMGAVAMMMMCLAAGCGGQKADSPNKGADNATVSQAAASAGGKMVVNFEGRVTKVDGDTVTLEDGKVVRISDTTTVSAPDGSETEISVGDYIQGYSENPDGDEIDAVRILITAL